jgi:hypothetical protein
MMAVVIGADGDVAGMAGQAAGGRQSSCLRRGLIVQLLPFSQGLFFF